VYDANETRFSGKTFSAEATSEHVRRLLYVIGGGDLGTRAADLDASLERMFDIATADATVLFVIYFLFGTDKIC
jgi:hypothetical protein